MKSVASSSFATLLGKGSRPTTASDIHKKRLPPGSESRIDQTSYALPPWPEWSDTDLNAEKWTVTQPTPSKMIDKRKPGVPSASSLLCYQDPMGHAQLPPSLEADTWVRIMTIPNVKVYDESAPGERLLDLVTPNTHLLKSEVMRWILATFMTLYQLARTRNFEIEQEGSDFSAPSGPWKPWLHVYGNCKVAKGTNHKPLVNPSGKYIVRLFYMGCWRRITVDDYLPLDCEKRPLLPMTMSGTEMWPALLTKALLKIASLTWNSKAEVRDFSVIGSLTGWHAQDLDLLDVPPRTIWWLCQKLLTGGSDNPDARFSGVTDTVVSDAYETCNKYSQGLSQSPSLGSELTDPNAEVFGSVVVWAILNTERGTEQFLDHPILLTEARIFFLEDEDRPPTPIWKTFRWKKWAVEQGIIVEDSKKVLSGIRIFSPITKLTPDVTGLLPKPKKAPIELVSQKNKKKPKKGEVVIKTPEPVDIKEAIYPEYWVEVGNLARHLKRFRIFYTTSSFKHNLKVTDIYTLISEKTSVPVISPKKGSQKELKDPSSASLMETSSNKRSPQILYLMMDTMSCKKLLITFSVLKPFSVTNLDPLTLSRTGLEGEPNTPTYYIMGEEYDWKSNSVGRILFAIKTVGTACKLIQLREGIIVLRLWIKLPDVYALRLSSQTPFIFGTKEKIQGSLGEESVSWMSYGADFSSAFNKLVKHNVLTDDHLELLKNLCRSYLPIVIPKQFRKNAAKLKRKIHEKFENTLIELLLEHTTDTEIIVKTVQELRWLFMDSNFGRKTLQDTPLADILNLQLDSKSRNVSTRNFNAPSTYNSQISISWPSSDNAPPDDVISRKYSFTSEKPPAVQERLHSLSFDDQSGVNFLRRMFGGDQEILKFYPFRDDDKHLISFVDYNGVGRNTMCDWVPLARFEVYTHSYENPLCTIYLSTTVAFAVLQVVNNDTLEHFPRFLDGIEPSHFPANRHGYTIFAFAFFTDREKMREFQWKIRIASVAYENLPHICSKKITGICSEEEPPEVIVLELKDHYIPNKDQTVFKCLLYIEKSQTLSMRAVMSKQCVEFVLRIRDDNEQIIKEYTAVGEIIVSVVRLTGKESGGPQFFVIEAEVVKNSWKLSPEEKTIVNGLKEKSLKSCLVFPREVEVKKSTSRMSNLVKMIRKQESRTILEPDAPHWSLALVVDQEMSSTVTFVKDKREEERVRTIKAGWEARDPGRFKRSCEIRENFLQNKLYCNKFADVVKDVQSVSKCGIILESVSQKESDRVTVIDEDYLADKLIHMRENISKSEEEYSGIRAQFDNIQSQQILRMQKLSEHMEELRDKSKEMISGAYQRRNECVTNLIEKIAAQKAAAAEEEKRLKQSKGGKNAKGSKKK